MKGLSSTSKTIFLLWCLNILTTVSAQTFYIPRDVRQAYDRQTRSTSGKPGERYWQNHAAYKIDVAIAPQLKKVTGTETITYTNHSPDTLASIYLKLIQNIHRPETFKVAFGEDKDFQTTGVTMESIKVNGKMTVWDNEKVWAGSDPVNAPVSLPAPLLPGGQITVDIHWEYELQTSENHREGMTDSTSFFCAYWYPRISVYDDVNGWDRVPFNDQIEFYNEFSDYDVTIRVPRNFIVWATGELVNADEVLEDRFVRLLMGTIVSDSPVKVITPADLRAGNITRNKPQLSWHFIATDVTDFAFGSSDHYLWEASSVIADAVNYPQPPNSQVPTPWLDLPAHIKIQFRLACVDPYGNTTNGIEKRLTPNQTFNHEFYYDAKMYIHGGLDAWPTEKYLNIWVCDIEDQLGNSTLPWEFYNTTTNGIPISILDGIILDYTVVGDPGLHSTKNKGRCAVHEVGHWLGLHHVDEGDACTIPGDEVNDTPIQDKAHIGTCPTYPSVSCINNPNNGDMFMNYMDQTADACMFMFTQGV